MNIIVKASEFKSPNKLDAILTISEFVQNLLDHSLYEPEEIDQAALKIYLILFYINSVSSDGLLNFLRKYCKDIEVIEKIYEGLGDIGASRHQVILKEACDILYMLDEDELNSFILTGDNNLEDQYRSKTVPVCFGIQEQNAAFRKLQQNAEWLIDLLYNFIGTLKNISVVSNHTYYDAMDEIYAAVPDYERRMQSVNSEAKQSDAVDLENIIAETCTKFHLNLIEINGINHSTEISAAANPQTDDPDGLIYCHFSTAEGKFYIKLHNNKADLYSSAHKEYIGNIF